MAFGSLMICLAAEMLEYLPPTPTAVAIGDLTFEPRGRDLSKVRDRLTRARRPFDAAALDRLRRLRGAEREAATPDYFRALGYAAYETVDIEAVAQPRGFTRSFNLVTGNETLAHVFDQHAFFTNMHRLCPQGGIMVHLAPFVGCANRGFFSVTPLLFTALADANRYQILRLAMVSARGEEMVASFRTIEERALARSHGILGRVGWFWRRWSGGDLARSVLQAARTGRDLSLLAVLRKTSDAPFAMPVHGRTTSEALDTRPIADGAPRPAAAREAVGGLTGTAAGR